MQQVSGIVSTPDKILSSIQSVFMLWFQLSARSTLPFTLFGLIKQVPGRCNLLALPWKFSVIMPFIERIITCSWSGELVEKLSCRIKYLEAFLLSHYVLSLSSNAVEVDFVFHLFGVNKIGISWALRSILLTIPNPKISGIVIIVESIITYSCCGRTFPFGALYFSFVLATALITFVYSYENLFN